MDVCLLIAMVWYGNNGERIDKLRMSALIASTQQWRESFVARLRALRKLLASPDTEYEAIATLDIAAAYTAIKQLELLAEKATLNSIATNYPLASQTTYPLEQRAKSIRLNVRYYLSSLVTVPDTAISSIISVLLDATNITQR